MANIWRFDKSQNIRYTDFFDMIGHNSNILGQLKPVHLTSLGKTDIMDWYANIATLATVQSQSLLASFYHKILMNLEATLKNENGTPSPIPFPDLEPKF